MIALEAIEKSYLVGGLPLQVLDQVSLRVDSGEFIALIGRSGSGKSSLLNIIGCLDHPSAGRYFLNGHNVSGLADNELAALRNRHIGFIFQNFNLIPRCSALKNIEKPLIYRGIKPTERRRLALAMLAKVGLSDRAEHLPSQLSGGQQQRVAIARALVTDPSLIIADEPTGSLDSATGGEIMRLLRALNHEGRTIVLVTHDQTLAAHADRVIELADGRITA
ncbi:MULTISPECIES: ABC transporter ATP-binding protein [unclassified Undibacterium]|uniref:ABC transporter ATP-binding protein n=1 Tax=unclassified Undibacterium TaxID=2630295 RepID=UPI002AC9AD66|nr:MULTISPECIES: ABC transporter ATP-binding protein [unclassified Undibacterium]MEB0140412.1 ABC transporter ATP-binding protein [Undibacterium sp. CCC2.1]MEB0171698.1 ABC transporter ATP-binding protein [Undibacterium sp. CCC1.1]MEB0177419.1 ABC transporter ATP-binding protein [Undibacterium sp. CCC3.4]MEB0215044.1 ABC transporter ATP-binding protein [Undibacterium sp. 5I2]WPX45109.1 ABC transporter ATP-binding protein [Undibacterium sp. CCC3.4]